MQAQRVYNQLLLENLNGSDATTKKMSDQEPRKQIFSCLIMEISELCFQ